MTSEWLTFFLSILCCQCFEAIPGISNSSARDSISCYKMMSEHSVYLEAGEPIRHHGPYSDAEIQLRNQNLETRQEELEATESGEACGEPRGQQLVVDFSPQAGDAEIEIRNQIYDVDSSSIEATSESEPGLVQARGDHMSRAQQRASRYNNGSETEETEEPRDEPMSSPDMTIPSSQSSAAVVNSQRPFKESKHHVKTKGNAVPSAADQIWEFQSCFSSPMSAFRRTDPLWKYFKTDKTSVHNDSEVELKSHLYTFVGNSVDKMPDVNKIECVFPE